MLRLPYGKTYFTAEENGAAVLRSSLSLLKAEKSGEETVKKTGT